MRITQCVRGALWMAVAVALLPAIAAMAQTNLREPVFRVSKANPRGDNASRAKEHPLDQALEMARDALTTMRRDVRDYTCLLVKRERVKGNLGEFEYMAAKIRQEQTTPDGRVITPFGVYLRFLRPSAIQGREVLYVKGQHNDKLVAREAKGAKALIGPVWLDPAGPLAMNGCLYPITDVGIENLLIKLIEKGERDRKHGECEVVTRKNAKINGRSCTMLEVRHPLKRAHFEFHIAHVFIDDELNLPIRYAAFSWPATPNGKPVLMEEYTYLNLQVNLGLTDRDFDYKNPDYRLN